MTFNGVVAVIFVISAKLVAFGARCVKVVEDIPKLSATEMQWVSAKLCGVEQRAPPMFGRATITLGICPHSSLDIYCQSVTARLSMD